jgi:hypothetical protein
MLENERTILVEVLVEAQPRRRSRKHCGERCLAHVERIAPHIIPVKLDQIERPHENVRVMPVSDTIEAGYAIVPTRHSFPVDNAGSGAESADRRDNKRKAVG